MAKNEIRVIALLRSEPEALSTPVVAMMLNISTECAGVALEGLFLRSRIERKGGDNPVYRIPVLPQMTAEEFPRGTDVYISRCVRLPGVSVNGTIN